MGALLTFADAKDCGLDEIERQANENKIKRYKLEETVWSLHLEGWSTPKIAKRCNELLIQRCQDPTHAINYVEVNATNVSQYLRLAKAHIAKEPASATEMEAVNKILPDVVEKVSNSCNLLENEIEKLRNESGPVVEARQSFFIRLLAELREYLKLAANMKGQLQPAVNINIFNKNVNSLCDRIMAESRLTSDAKQVILNIVADTVFTPDLVSGESPVKTVEARVVEVPNGQQ